MKRIHSLLTRQLKRHFGDVASIPEGCQGFIQAVNDAYWESDMDRAMLERSLDLSSQELLEANSQMRAIFQAIPDLLFRLDREGTILEYKAGTTHDFFIDPKDLLGKRIQDIPIEHVQGQFLQAVKYVRQELSTTSIEYSLSVQGQNCFYEARLVPLLDAQIMVIVRNLTPRKEMELALRRAHNELEERIEQRTAELKKANEQLEAIYQVGQTITKPLQLHVVLETIAHSTVELLGSDTGVILLLNETEESLTIHEAIGLSEKVMKGTHDRLGESIAGRVVQTGQPIIANDLPHDPLFYNPSASQEGLLACISVPLMVGGKIIGTLDAHSKTKPDAFNEEHIRILGMLAGQAAIAIENARLYQELQLAHDELEARVQQRTAELVDANKHLQQEVLERQRAEERLYKLNEELEVRVEARTIELKNSNNALKESLATIKQTQDQLVQSEKMAALGGLVAGVAHEINTPLGIGVTAASHLEDQTRNMKQRYHDRTMTRSALETYLKTASDVTKMLLTNLQWAANFIQSFKQVAVDQTSEKKRRFKLKRCIDDVLLSLGPELKKTAHVVTVDCPQELELDSYPGVFSQILTNFIMNSLLHGFDLDTQGSIEVNIHQEHDTLHMRYSDNGKGMKQQEKLRIFEPFYTTKRGQGGSGLGLHIVFNLVTQQLNGSIHCESEQGAGTTFFIQIPLHAERSNHDVGDKLL